MSSGNSFTAPEAGSGALAVLEAQKKEEQREAEAEEKLMKKRTAEGAESEQPMKKRKIDGGDEKNKLFAILRLGNWNARKFPDASSAVYDFCSMPAYRASLRWC
jgi:hypothetical protein